jgi:hypothetical protein
MIVNRQPNVGKMEAHFLDKWNGSGYDDRLIEGWE